MKKIWEVDPDYCRYMASHYPEAIEFIRKNVENFKTEGTVKNINDIWIDIEKYSTFSNRAPDGSCLRGTDKVILFCEIVFDIFPRKIKPQYVKPYEANVSQNKYITWAVATKDILKQKDGGYAGERWVLKCQLDKHVGERTVEIPEKEKYIDNPEYTAYFKSPEYLKYKNDYSEYKQKFQEYEQKSQVFREFRTKYHVFKLTDGTTKPVLLYNRPEEKFDMLSKLGVSESEIQKYRDILVNKPIEPIEPVPPQKPWPRIRTVIPCHSVQKKAWFWKHFVKSVKMLSVKNLQKQR